MQVKSDPDAIEPYLGDASYMKEGHADRLVFPESCEEVAEILSTAYNEKTPVTISGAGTGTVGGRIPTSGIIIATDKLNQIKSLARTENGGRAVAEAGVRLSDLQQFVEAERLLYPPDPTERSCFLGGTIATNASGARTFKYGPTRNYIERLRVVLANGDVVDLKRGEVRADPSGEFALPLLSGNVLRAKLPTYQMPRTRKHASGYFVRKEMDVLDLFIGSEGTLGVVVEAEVALLPKPSGLLSGVVFFDSEEKLLAFVREARDISTRSRKTSADRVANVAALMEKAMEITSRPVPKASDGSATEALDARAIEYFDRESLGFLRQKYDTIPEEAVGAVFFEQETSAQSEEALMGAWLSLLERHEALGDASWFATNEVDQARLREFRHALPVLMNEWFAKHRQRKVSTDMSVPDEAFAGMLQFYQDQLRPSGLRHTIFGHIGDNHVHVNILPRDDDEAAKAREIYVKFVKRAVEVGGTVSAEHGIGKLKREYLRMMYSEEHVRGMVALKRAFDPGGILGRGNIFPESYLD